MAEQIELKVVYADGQRTVEVSGLPSFSAPIRLPARAYALAELVAHRSMEHAQRAYSPAHFMAAVVRTLIDQGWLNADSSPVYSGSRSREFWTRIGALPDEVRSEVFGLGCELQNLEHRVLEAVARAEAGKRPVVNADDAAAVLRPRAADFAACAHDWRPADNEAVKGMEICPRCWHVRPVGQEGSEIPLVGEPPAAPSGAPRETDPEDRICPDCGRPGREHEDGCPGSPVARDARMALAHLDETVDRLRRGADRDDVYALALAVRGLCDRVNALARCERCEGSGYALTGGEGICEAYRDECPDCGATGVRA